MIFDESLSALDAPVRRRIIELLCDIQSSQRLTYILISHDLGLLASCCQEILVMHQGRLVEAAVVHKLLTEPVHHHTRELVAAIPGYPAEW
jgi:peptide/nickel transport system ATP-binding protein